MSPSSAQRVIEPSGARLAHTRRAIELSMAHLAALCASVEEAEEAIRRSKAMVAAPNREVPPVAALGSPYRQKVSTPTVSPNCCV